MSAHPIDQEFAVVIAALLAGRIDGQQAVASLVAIHERTTAGARRLLEYALSLRMHGEDKGETWPDFDMQNERFLRGFTLPTAAQITADTVADALAIADEGHERAKAAGQ